MAEIYTTDGGQKDDLLRRAKVKKKKDAKAPWSWG